MMFGTKVGMMFGTYVGMMFGTHVGMMFYAPVKIKWCLGMVKETRVPHIFDN